MGVRRGRIAEMRVRFPPAPILFLIQFCFDSLLYEIFISFSQKRIPVIHKKTSPLERYSREVFG